MSDEEPILLNAPVDLERASELVRKIVNEAQKDGTLSKLTPRVVRQKVEQELELDPGTLDEKEYKGKLKSIIQDAVDATNGSGDESEGRDKQEGSSKGNSKKTPAPPKTKPKQKKATKRESTSDVDSNQTRKRKKDVTSEIGPAGPSDRTNKPKDAPIPETKKVEVPLEKKPDVVKLTNETAPAKYQSDSEMSILIDEPPPKKRKKRASDETSKEKKSIKEKKPATDTSPAEEQIKKLKSLVVACGVRKQWARELEDCETTSQQINHLKKLLTDLGMKGRFSMEQAKTIKQKRELAKEIQDVREFAEKHAGEGRVSRSANKSANKGAKSKKALQNSDDDRDDENGGSEDDEEEGGNETNKNKSHRRKVNAHRSIMAFLGDQSDSD
ncbi:hypothetical protein SCHPADRAFT_933695 [Schizopora paradoxa]|uniref:DEK-C domain-containing protein n=1 Tax=Schizopora paradoxa TaxID=27342 RepID=A0A0H2R1V2_9AGAM|nr:hypothetical protein SCHPADRAFT_933695 [Schizopora paradoxa]